MNKIHYVYEIINLKNNKKYIGVRTHPDPENDNYMGSSRVMDSLYNIEGKENFRKYIIQKFNTREEAEKYESSLLTEEFCNSPDTYNIMNTGKFSGEKHGFRKDLWYDYYSEIRIKYKQGEPCSRLSNYYNCDKGTIRTIIKDLTRTNSKTQQLRDKTSFARNTYLDDNINKIIDMYINEKMSMTDIGKEFNVSGTVIGKRLIDNNILIRNKSQCVEFKKSKNHYVYEKHEKEIIELYKLKYSIRKISKECGCSIYSVKAALKENNLEIRKKI